MNGDLSHKVKELLNVFSEALLLNPKNVRVLVLRGLLWEQQRNYELAIRDFNSLIHIGNKNGYFLRAYSYCSLGKLDLALVDIEQASAQEKQPIGLFHILAYITKRRNEIVKEIETDYLREQFGENYGSMDFVKPN